MRFRHVSYRGFEFYVPEPEAEAGSADDVGMQHWFDASLRSTLTYAEQVWHVNRFIEDSNLSILEVFCGFGMSTVTIPEGRIEKHVGLDHDMDCCQAFQFLRPDADVLMTDSYIAAPVAARVRQFDCIYLEFNSMTVYRAMREEVERGLLDSLLTSGARYIIFVDSAKVKEHLHYKTYSEFFDENIKDSRSYVNAVDQYFRHKYGYHMRACAYDNINYTYLLDAEYWPIECDMIDTRKVVNLSQFKHLGYIDAGI